MRVSSAIQKAMGEAVHEAVRMHKLPGHPIIVWRDGKVVEIPPEEIVLDEPASPSDAPQRP